MIVNLTMFQIKSAQTKSIKLKYDVIIYYNGYGDIKNENSMLVFHGGLTCNLQHFLSETIAKKYNLPLSISDRPNCGRTRSPLSCKKNSVIYHHIIYYHHL